MRQLFPSRQLFFPLVLVSFIILIYSNSLHKEFMLDDYVDLIGNDSLKSVEAGQLFTKDFKGYYRPVTFLILKAAVSVFGENPAAYHLYNAVIFFTICWLFYFLLYKLTRRADLAMLAGLLYAVHPINNFFLNYKTASNTSLNILCLQLGVVFFVAYLENKKICFYAASVLIYAVSLLIHEISFILPVYLFLIMYYFKSFDLRRDIRLFVPFAIVFMLYFWVRAGMATAIKISPALIGFSVFTYLGTLMKLILWYGTKLFVPTHIIFIWDERTVTGLPAAGYTALFVFLAAALIIFFFKGRRSPAAFGLMLFAAGLGPLALAGFTYTGKVHSAIIEPHWFGFSSIGFFIVAAGALLGLKKFLPAKVAVVLILLTLATAGALTHAANRVWKNEEVYCRYWILENSINGTPWNALARKYALSRDLGTTDPRHYKNCREASYLGLAYHIIGQADLSFAFYSLALKIDGFCAPVYYGLSLLYDQMQEASLAASNLNHARTLDARFEPIYGLLRDAFHDKSHPGDGRKIIQYFEAIPED
ncbi:MAG TPA: hypothetical protein VJA17_00230 [Candidatus Omnitrophota bacterium]|nr:hypothetical protein [Candidatus Omnitrophota bacterium]